MPVGLLKGVTGMFFFRPAQDLRGLSKNWRVQGVELETAAGLD